MRKKVAILLLMTVLGSVSGCASAFPRDRQANSEIEEVKLSQDKEDLLIGISMDEERIRNGKGKNTVKALMNKRFLMVKISFQTIRIFMLFPTARSKPGELQMT